MPAVHSPAVDRPKVGGHVIGLGRGALMGQAIYEAFNDGRRDAAPVEVDESVAGLGDGLLEHLAGLLVPGPAAAGGCSTAGVGNRYTITDLSGIGRGRALIGTGKWRWCSSTIEL